MAMLLFPEPVIMFLLGFGLVSLARFGRIFLKKQSPTKTLLWMVNALWNRRKPSPR